MKELVIGVGDGGVSRDADTMLITYALGSCVALMLHDPVARVAGMVHYMLPESPQSPPERDTRPYKFADTAIPSILPPVFRRQHLPERRRDFWNGNR